jgi:inosine/xanthosine triphosphatase
MNVQEECLVAVGSTNPTKVNAVRRAVRLLCNARVESVAVESGVPPQPSSYKSVMLGAVNRAVRALEATNADYGVGIEAGFDIQAGIPVEFQVAAVVDRDGRVSLGLSPGFMLPQEWLGELLAGKELGSIAEKVTGRKGAGERLGLIGYLTYGHITRLELSYYATVMALVPLLNRRLYSTLPRYTELIEELRKEGL